jgi:hypothetical protein
MYITVEVCITLYLATMVYLSSCTLSQISKHLNVPYILDFILKYLHLKYSNSYIL